nr:cellulose biosynthesis cyclic di-GMP-binding regulatory protein BcsB [Paracoccus sp. Z118]
MQRRLLVGLLAGTLASFQPVLAQEEPPLILLDTQQEESSTGTPEDAEGQPRTGPVEVPQIQLPSAHAVSEAAGAQGPLVIPERDRSEGALAAPAQQLLVPLIPTRRLTDVAQIGASQPTPGILRLTGEVVSVDFELDLPESAAVPPELMLTLRSTVNVLPDVAGMTISINDTPPVVIPLDHLSGFRTVAVPAAGLTSGVNRVRLDLRQPHRIYCGPEASFSVWTEIHLPQSGAPIDANAVAADAAGFALALHAQMASGRAVPVRIDEDEDAAPLQQLAERLSRWSDGQARIELRSFYSLETPSPLSIALIRSNRSHAELREGADGGLVLQVEHVEGQLPSLDDLLPKLPSPSNIVPALSPGDPTALAELGQQDIIGRTRYFRHEVPFDLPKDWLLLSNQKARLQLRYGFADSLPEGAILLVKANDETIRLLPLDRNGGQMQEPLDIIFSANLLHSGRNSLIFEMMVPGDPPDEICLPRRADMLVVSSDSTLLVPPAPAMTLAGISEPLSGLGSGDITVPDGVLDRTPLDRAAAEMAAGLPPAPASADPSVRLNVISVSDMSLIPTEHLGVTGRTLQEALITLAPLPAAKSPSPSIPAAPRYQLTEDAPEAAQQSDPDAGSKDNTGLAGSWRLRNWLAGVAARLEAASFIGSDESLSSWLETKQGSALLLRPNPEEPNDLWLVLGPQISAQSTLRALVQLRDSGQANGEAAILMANGTWATWSPVRPPELREPLRLSNLPAVLGNYASWSPLLFTIAILGVALLSAIPALFFILFTRRRGQI